MLARRLRGHLSRPFKPLTFAVFLLCLVWAAGSMAEPLVVRYWGASPGRLAYEWDLLRAALDASGGDYRLSLVERSLGTDRGREEVARGELINLYASGYRRDEPVQQGRLQLVSVPIMNGLLGYRVPIVRTDRAQSVRSALRSGSVGDLILGQGTHWEDVAIYRHNGFTVDDSGHYPLLLRMLAHRRFDAVPLGVVEAAPVLDASPHAAELTLLSDTMIYYPLPMVFYVSANAPELFGHLQRGMTRIRENGTLGRLLERHFGPLIDQLRSGDYSLTVLKNPNASQTLGLDRPHWTESPSSVHRPQQIQFLF